MQSMSDFIESAKVGELDMVRGFLQSGVNVNYQEEQDGTTALYWAACKGHTSTCACLLQGGADPRLPAGKSGSGPLHAAADNGKAECVLLLLTWGADPNAQNESNLNTALHMAAYRGHLDACRTLLDRGADPLITNRQQRTPKMEAQAKQHYSIYKLLNDHEQGLIGCKRHSPGRHTETIHRYVSTTNEPPRYITSPLSTSPAGCLPGPSHSAPDKQAPSKNGKVHDSSKGEIHDAWKLEPSSPALNNLLSQQEDDTKSFYKHAKMGDDFDCVDDDDDDDVLDGFQKQTQATDLSAYRVYTDTCPSTSDNNDDCPQSFPFFTTNHNPYSQEECGQYQNWHPPTSLEQLSSFWPSDDPQFDWANHSAEFASSTSHPAEDAQNRYNGVVQASPVSRAEAEARKPLEDQSSHAMSEQKGSADRDKTVVSNSTKLSVDPHAVPSPDRDPPRTPRNAPRQEPHVTLEKYKEIVQKLVNKIQFLEEYTEKLQQKLSRRDERIVQLGRESERLQELEAMSADLQNTVSAMASWRSKAEQSKCEVEELTELLRVCQLRCKIVEEAYADVFSQLLRMQKYVESQAPSLVSVGGCGGLCRSEDRWWRGGGGVGPCSVGHCAARRHETAPCVIAASAWQPLTPQLHQDHHPHHSHHPQAARLVSRGPSDAESAAEESTLQRKRSEVSPSQATCSPSSSSSSSSCSPTSSSSSSSSSPSPVPAHVGLGVFAEWEAISSAMGHVQLFRAIRPVFLLIPGEFRDGLSVSLLAKLRDRQQPGLHHTSSAELLQALLSADTNPWLPGVDYDFADEEPLEVQLDSHGRLSLAVLRIHHQTTTYRLQIRIVEAGTCSLVTGAPGLSSADIESGRLLSAYSVPVMHQYQQHQCGRDAFPVSLRGGLAEGSHVSAQFTVLPDYPANLATVVFCYREKEERGFPPLPERFILHCLFALLSLGVALDLSDNTGRIKADDVFLDCDLRAHFNHLDLGDHVSPATASFSATSQSASNAHKGSSEPLSFVAALGAMLVQLFCGGLRTRPLSTVTSSERLHEVPVYWSRALRRMLTDMVDRGDAEEPLSNREAFIRTGILLYGPLRGEIMSEVDCQIWLHAKMMKLLVDPPHGVSPISPNGRTSVARSLPSSILHNDPIFEREFISGVSASDVWRSYQSIQELLPILEES